MSVKNLVFVLPCHQGYIRHIEDERKYAAENNILFSSISRMYLPLLRMLQRLEQDGVQCTISLAISPIVCSLLADTVVQQQYVDWLEQRIALGEKEVERCKAAPEFKIAENYLAGYKQDLLDFTETHKKNLIRAFARFAKKGFVELLATAGSYAFLPHYADMTEVLNAQVETGLYSHRYYFGSRPEGFWLPYLGYAQGVEKVLRSYGLNYTYVDTHAVLFSETPVKTGIFSPVRCRNSLVLFPRDIETPADMIGEQGFATNTVYKDPNRDIGFELPHESLGDFALPGEARLATGFGYWSKAGSTYDSEKAHAQVLADAKTFVAAKREKLEKASEALSGEPVTLVCALPMDEILATWSEGIDFLEQVIREAADLQLTSGAALIANQFSLQKIVPYPSAATGSGYGEDLLDSSNGWMLRYVRRMCTRMIDLSGRFPDDTGLKVRLLNLGARELMIAQGAEWPKMLHEGQMPDYVTEHFKAAIRAFITVFDSLGSNTVSTEWLTRLERAHTLFPWMNFRIFAQKR